MKVIIKIDHTRVTLESIPLSMFPVWRALVLSMQHSLSYFIQKFALKNLNLSEIRISETWPKRMHFLQFLQIYLEHWCK